MIENQPEVTKGMESAMKALEQAKARKRVILIQNIA